MMTRTNPMIHLLRRSNKAEQELFYKELQILKDAGTPTTAQEKELLRLVWLAINKGREITRQERQVIQAMRLTQKPKTETVKQ